MWIQGLGEQGQRKLKSSSVLISRIGGVGGLVAYQLAAAGVGKLVLAHAGVVKPSHWKREFPVLGAVAGTVGCLGAMEAIKWICGFGEGLQNRLLIFDLRDMRFRTIQLQRNLQCSVCGLNGKLQSTTR